MSGGRRPSHTTPKVSVSSIKILTGYVDGAVSSAAGATRDVTKANIDDATMSALRSSRNLTSQKSQIPSKKSQKSQILNNAFWGIFADFSIKHID